MQGKLVAFYCLGRFFNKLSYQLLRRKVWRSKVRLVEPPADSVKGMDLQAFGKTGFIAYHQTELDAEGIGQRVRKCREQYSGFGIGTSKKYGSV